MSGGIPPRDTPADKGFEARAAGGDAGGEGAAALPRALPSAAQQGEGTVPGGGRGLADVLQVIQA